MRTRSNTAGLSILAGGLAFVGSVNAVDLIINGSFEDAETTSDFTPAGWTGVCRGYNYSAAYFTGPPIPSSENSGNVYSWRHRGSTGDAAFATPMTQLVNLLDGASAGEIDAGRGQYTFSAWLASYGTPGNNPDQPYLTLQFLDAASAQVGGTVVLDRVNSAFFTTFADGVTLFDSAAHLHDWAKYVRTSVIPVGARTALVGIQHSPNSPLSGAPDTYTDLVKFDVQAVAFVPPSLASTAPVGNNVRADAVVSVRLQDGTAQVNTNTIQLSFDGLLVVPSVVKSGPATTITYDPPGLLLSGSTHAVRLVFSDDSVVPGTQTNLFSFSVATYTEIQLNAPLYLETFDDLPEGGVPAGWSQASFSAAPDLNIDFGDLNSAAYTNWNVVAASRFTGPLLTYNSHTPETDYQRVLTFNPANVVNGQVIDALAQTNIFFANSGYRDGGYQVLYAFTGDYDLSGQTNVFISFHSLYEQNQDSIGAVEYSIDEGASWLPVVYLIDFRDMVLDAADDVDAVATFTSNRTDIATYTDPITSELKGGNYGAFIAAPISQALAPFISGRLDDNPLESKRVELFRLPAADNRPKVRFRFAYAGTDSWYFGIDNFGIYSLPTAPVSIVRQPPALVRSSVGTRATISVQAAGTPPFSYQWRSNGVDIAGATAAKLVITNLQPSHGAIYSVRIGNAGGAIVSGDSVLQVFQPRLTGQWDFNQGDLRATVGEPMEYRGNTAAITVFTNSFFIDEFDYAPVMCFTNTEISQGWVVRPGAAPNAGGSNVNQYTLILDVFYPATSVALWRALWQTDPQNAAGNDAEFYINSGNGIGVNGIYDGVVNGDIWTRLAFVVDLSAPSAVRLGKFIDGVRVGTQTLDGIDSRWSVQPSALLFTTGLTPAANTAPGCVNSIQFVEGILSDATIAGLGRAGIDGIPTLRTSAEINGSNVTIRWTGAPGVGLERSTSITSPAWQQLPSTLGASSYNEAVSDGPVFYRLYMQ